MDSLNIEISRWIDQKREALSESITARQYELQPDLAARYGEIGRKKCLQDANYHLSYLSESIAASSPSLFADYVAWAKVMLASRNIPAEDLSLNLEIISERLREALPREMGDIISNYIEAGLKQLPQFPSILPSFLGDTEPLSFLSIQYLNALLRGERHIASRLIMDAVQAGTDIENIYLYVFQRSQYEIGRLWQMNQLSVAQEHYCTAATQLIMSQLYPYIFATEKNGRTLVATCVAGELHEIGVRMIADFFEMKGWDTFYLGANTPTQSIIQTIIDRRADVLAVSATITSYVSAVANLIRAVRSSEGCKGLKIIVGGYPFNVVPNLWQQIGADASARDAKESIETAVRLVTG
jgi:MerR family transcriptional regulator, light-induced transcriptional regulator